MALVSNHIFQIALMHDPKAFHENNELPEIVVEIDVWLYIKHSAIIREVS